MSRSCDGQIESFYCERTLTFRDGLSQRIFDLERKNQATLSHINTSESKISILEEKVSSFQLQLLNNNSSAADEPFTGSVNEHHELYDLLAKKRILLGSNSMKLTK